MYAALAAPGSLLLCTRVSPPAPAQHYNPASPLPASGQVLALVCPHLPPGGIQGDPD